MAARPPSDLSRLIREANRFRYGDGREVATYLPEPYHALRLQLGVALLENELCRHGPTGNQLIMDIGAAEGAACLALRKIGLDPVAADAEFEPLRAARRVEVIGIQFDATGSFPVREGALAGIFMGELLEHVWDPTGLLSECWRALALGGVLVLTTPNLANFQDRLRFLIGRSPRHVNPNHEYLRLHIRPFTYSLLATTLRVAGLEPSRLLSNFVVWRHEQRVYQSRLLARLMPSLGGSLIVSARKV
jgi:SAM-dependent methyltransferase